MYFIGLDLAWGMRNRTGIAVASADGELEFLASAVTDEEILAAVAPFVTGPCFVGIDAPLVVVNPAGMRAAERALNRDFRPFDAGAYPAHLGLAPFRDTPRGARIAESLGLEVDPKSAAQRRAAEVYPHSAAVALFRLGRTLKYKRRKGRSVKARRSAMLQLIGLIEGLGDRTPRMRVTASAEWLRLRQTVERAARPVDLDRAEDPIDAVLCAYIALYATRWPDDMTVYGDLQTGYILTPTLPADLVPG
ncbi:DUF429 domain-containing protein [Mycobacterium asiaticum]|uniref:GTP pyrophosphokinase n=1 Tax=Mycobacterium asiaticum TaxID=1790 RepID=A0A1A3N735_MYCAS|nr:DUF429 domain-containing protein [Mycobacterium asiaticum]OBK17611.1 GTP pyrophosphokinase [Mycobacterium asiaticum]